MINHVLFNNLGTVNKNEIRLTGTNGSLRLIFSYRTLVIIIFGGVTYCRANDWGVTTGKLLNEYEPDKTARLTEEDFLKRVTEAMTYINS